MKADGSDNRLLVFNIQKYSLHDGAGIRTVVFLKGCPLRCRWCCNPESQKAEREIMFRKGRCLGRDKCGLCMEAAPDGAVKFDAEGIPQLDFEKANGCPDWSRVCPSKAFEIQGKWTDIDEILKKVSQDEAFYRSGRGGLTLSGGEPLMQANSLILLKKAKEMHMNTAIETCGCVKEERILEAAEYLDEIFFDLKSLNDEKHLEYTGSSNVQIRKNLISLSRDRPDQQITVRTPVIPGFNDSPRELEAIERFLSSLENVKWQKLRYHTYGAGKYEMLGRRYMMPDI